MLVEQKEEYLDYIKDVENLMDRRFQVHRFKDKLIFLVVDEFAALRISRIRKNLMKSKR